MCHILKHEILILCKEIHSARELISIVCRYIHVAGLLKARERLGSNESLVSFCHKTDPQREIKFGERSSILIYAILSISSEPMVLF